MLDWHTLVIRENSITFFFITMENELSVLFFYFFENLREYKAHVSYALGHTSLRCLEEVDREEGSS